MRIYMQTPPESGKATRFCQLTLQQDLLEGWTVVREMGYQGYSGQVKREHYASREAAEEALLAQRDAQLRRGYQVVFSQGHPGHR
jgi:predicted DNA-binding WGR domain protein